MRCKMNDKTQCSACIVLSVTGLKWGFIHENEETVEPCSKDTFGLIFSMIWPRENKDILSDFDVQVSVGQSFE